MALGLSALLTGVVLLAVPAAPARGAAGLFVDLSPEPATAVVGVPVTLVVNVRDDAEQPVAGAGARVYFVGGPNDPGGPGNSPDFTCTTVADGTCSVTYTPSAIGTDTLCAVVTGAPFQCDESVDAPELDDNEDVTQVIVLLVAPSQTPAPSSTPSPAPTVAPTPAPTAAPTPEPTLPPTPAPTVAPTPDPTLAPTPEPTTAPTPAPTVAPTPDPTLAPTPEPTAAPTAAPTPVPTTAPTPVPTAAPTAEPTVAPTTAPTALPTTAPTPEPTVAPTATPTVAPTAAPTATPTATATATLEPEPTAAPDATHEPAATAVPTAIPTAPASAAPTLAPTLPPTPASTAGSPVESPGIVIASSTTDTAGPTNGDTDGGFFQSVLSAVYEQVQSTVRPEAVQAVAATFTFPLALAVLVLLFLVLQRRLDDRDPKLRHAPRSAGEAYLAFQEEDR